LANTTPERAATVTRVAAQVDRAVTGYMAGNLFTSVIAGAVVFVTLLVLGVPFPFLWALWVALVDFLPMIGGALAGIPTVLFATGHSLTAGIVTLVVFLAYTQIENHILNPVVMSRTVQINPLLVLVSILVGASVGSWIGGLFGGFVAALLAIPIAGAGQVVASELWRDTAPPAPSAPPGPPEPGAGAVAPAGAGPGAALVAGTGSAGAGTVGDGAAGAEAGGSEAAGGEAAGGKAAGGEGAGGEGGGGRAGGEGAAERHEAGDRAAHGVGGGVRPGACLDREQALAHDAAPPRRAGDR